MRIIITLLALALSNMLYAQVTNYADRMDHIFGAIDKSKVNTGLLKEFGIRFTEIEAFNGILSASNYADITNWHSTYSSFYTMRVGTNTLMQGPDIISDSLESLSELNEGTVLIAAMHYNYNQYKSNAYTNGDVTVVNDRIYDVAGRNPYDTKIAFLAVPLETNLTGSTFDFELRSDMFFTNSGKTIASIQIDFGNGQGYINVSIDNVVAVTYTSGGEKIIRVRIAYTDASIVDSQSNFYLDYIDSSPAARYGFPSIPTFVRTATKSYLGGFGVGEITVEYDNVNGIFDKPLIIVE